VIHGYKNRRVFITGVAGFLGSHLADRFITDGYQVAGNDNLIGGYLDNVPEQCEFHQVDCNEFAVMRNLLEGVDIVYHCAATAYEGFSVFSPHLVTQNIVTASTAVISAAIANRVKRFILCSSMARYGENQIPFTEDLIPKPQDPYGIGKYTSELMLANLCDVHGMEHVIAVPHNIVGPRQKYDDPYRNVASIFINLMLQGRQPYIYGDGNQMRCFSFVQDVVSPLALMATSNDVVGEIINIGPDDEFITINELAKMIADLLDFKLDANHTAKRPQEVFFANCSAEKARRLLNYRPSTSLRDGLHQMVEYIRSRNCRHFTYHLDLEIINDKTPETWKRKLF
jgi:UDP-glucose 4-epimerase